jgi:coenzyme F420-reducing hydrogenase beta subunit
MINKNKILKEKCTGCCACVNICPQNAIEMKINEEGFYFPVVDEKKCTRCGLCLGVCPVLNENDSRNKSPKEVYACRSLDRANQIASSSGGIFSELSNKILDRGGVVFGAVFKEGEVKHISIEKKEDLYLLKGSKYLQSSVGNSFQKALSFLKEGRMVFFSGTPCQIAGLRSFMKKKEADTSCLFCADLVCHGVPSYRLFQDHIRKISKGKTLKNVYFRNKRFGWRNYSLVYVFEDETTKKIHFQRIFL